MQLTVDVAQPATLDKSIGSLVVLGLRPTLGGEELGDPSKPNACVVELKDAPHGSGLDRIDDALNVGEQWVPVAVLTVVDFLIVVAKDSPTDHVALLVKPEIGFTDAFACRLSVRFVSVALHVRQNLVDGAPWCERLAVAILENLDTGFGELFDDPRGLRGFSADGLSFRDDQPLERWARIQEASEVRQARAFGELRPTNPIVHEDVGSVHGPVFVVAAVNVMVAVFGSLGVRTVAGAGVSIGVVVVVWVAISHSPFDVTGFVTVTCGRESSLRAYAGQGNSQPPCQSQRSLQVHKVTTKHTQKGAGNAQILNKLRAAPSRACRHT